MDSKVKTRLQRDAKGRFLPKTIPQDWLDERPQVPLPVGYVTQPLYTPIPSDLKIQRAVHLSHEFFPEPDPLLDSFLSPRKGIIVKILVVAAILSIAYAVSIVSAKAQEAESAQDFTMAACRTRMVGVLMTDGMLRLRKHLTEAELLAIQQVALTKVETKDPRYMDLIEVPAVTLACSELMDDLRLGGVTLSR
jgi:hypothetical protein